MECCTKYYEVCQKVPNCLSELGVVTPVINDTVQIVIIDKFGNEYKQDVETESSGLALIDLAEFPSAMINQFAGNFYLKVFKSGELVPFVKNSISYDGLIFSCANVTPIQTDYTIDIFNELTDY